MPQVACWLVRVWYGRSVLLILSTWEGEAFTEMLERLHVEIARHGVCFPVERDFPLQLLGS